MLFFHCLPCSGVWTISGTPFDPRDPRNLAFAAAEQRLLEAENSEYAENSANGAAFCRSAALIVCYVDGPFLLL